MKRKQEEELKNRKKLARKAVKPELERTFSEYKLEMPRVNTLTICYVHPAFGLLAQVPIVNHLFIVNDYHCACATTHNITGFVYCVNWDVRSFLLMTDKEFDDLKDSMSLGPISFPCTDPDYCTGGIHLYNRFPKNMADIVTDMRKPTAFEPSPALCEKELMLCSSDLPTETINLLIWWCRMIHATVNDLHI
jgi:hypothetical protein